MFYIQTKTNAYIGRHQQKSVLRVIKYDEVKNSGILDGILSNVIRVTIEGKIQNTKVTDQLNTKYIVKHI